MRWANRFVVVGARPDPASIERTSVLVEVLPGVSMARDKDASGSDGAASGTTASSLSEYQVLSSLQVRRLLDERLVLFMAEDEVSLLPNASTPTAKE